MRRPACCSPSTRTRPRWSGPGSHPAMLTEPDRKAELIEPSSGVDALCVLPFTPEFMPAVAGDVRPRRAGRAPARRAGRGRGELPLRAQGGRRRRRCSRALGRPFGFAVEGVAAGRRRRRRGHASPRPTSAPASTPATWRRGRARSAGRTGSTASSSAATGAAASSASRRPTSMSPPYAAIPADGVYAGRLVTRDRAAAPAATLPGRDLGRHQPDVRRAAAHGRGVRAGLRRRPLRRARRRRLRRSACARWRAFDDVEPLVAPDGARTSQQTRAAARVTGMVSLLAAVTPVVTDAG